MARGVNKVILIGGVGADPEVRFAPSGTTIANIRLATSDIWTDRDGARQERTEWHSLVLFNKTAEIAQQYVTKGSKLYIEGRLQTRKWQDQSGQDRYRTEIVVNDMQMLGGGQQQAPQQQGNYQQQQPQQQGNYQQPQQPAPQQPAPQQPAPQQQGNYQQQQPQQQGNYQQQPPMPQQQPQGGGGSMDDEIPFAGMHYIQGG